jgi:hypothetical protein
MGWNETGVDSTFDGDDAAAGAAGKTADPRVRPPRLLDAGDRRRREHDLLEARDLLRES